MKKEYTAPQIEVIEIGVQTIMAASDLGKDDQEIDFGKDDPEILPEPDEDDEFWAD